MENEYKKSYRGFVLFFVCYLSLMIGGAIASAYFLSEHATRIVINILCVGMALLTYIIYKYDKIYWYNGIEFEDAEKASKERRNAYAKAHLKLFCIFAACMLAFSVIMALLSVSPWVDFAVGAVGICTVAICTVKIKL